MSPLDTQSKGFKPHRARATRPRRPDFNELAAEEYRRALRSLLQAKGERQYVLAA